MMSFRLFATAAVAALCLAGTPALAQDAPTKPAATTKPKAPAAKPAPKPAQVAPVAAPAASAAEPAPTLEGAKPPALSTSQPDWVKICETDQSKKQICVVSRDLRSETGQTIMKAIVMQNVTDKRQIMRLILPVGALIPSGVGIYLDSALFATGQYVVCSPDGCLVEIPVDDSKLDIMRKAKSLTVVFKTPMPPTPENAQATQNVQLPLGIDGFAAAIDGNAINPQTIVDEQKKLQEQLQQAAEKARKQLNANPAPAQ